MSDDHSEMNPRGAHVPDDALERAGELLQELTHSPNEMRSHELREFADLLAQLIELSSECDPDQAQAADQQRVAHLLVEGTEAIRSALNDQPEALGRIAELKRETVEQWGEHLKRDKEAGSDDWDRDLLFDDEFDAGDDDEPEIEAPSQDDISQLLAALGEVTSDRADGDPPVESEHVAAADASDSAAVEARAVGAEDNAPTLPGGSLPCDDPPLEGELRDAFLDDAGRCVAALEESSLAFESCPERVEPVQRILRELHTLKGAAGSVGLGTLAAFIHELEESIRGYQSQGKQPPADALIESIDAIRNRVDQIRKHRPAETLSGDSCGEDVAAPQPDSAASPPDAPIANTFDETSGDEESVRVKSSQLNRLMAMLSELVMLRNRRGMELGDLETAQDSILKGVSQIRTLTDAQLMSADNARRNAGEVDSVAQARRLNEIANDLLESAQQLRECYQPVSESNAAVSRFIRNFRQELVELRRTPVSGLFRRLRRAIRDAARVEAKQVELTLIGEETGIERSLQERIYEPLLHIVRNCVSHGVETAEDRGAAGKQPAGQITLAAHSGPDLLMIEVRDDGRGLDYDGIRRRGIERGMLKPDMAPSREELAQLIFQPGFSTRDVASEIAGRGVGMDVVAATLDKMRGWVQVESVPGEGTTIRLHFPVPSIIQHTMLFRSSGQLFALPMQFVQEAGGDPAEVLPVRSADLLGTRSAGREAPLPAGEPPRSGQPDAANDGALLVLNCESVREDGGRGHQQVAILVDEIVGPEEVVVRSLPGLLKQHPLCSGATLSGMGEIVLVLDAHRLAELGVHRQRSGESSATITVQQDAQSAARSPRVLVTDDSLSARKRVIQALGRYDVRVVEAGDGAEAIELLKTESFAAVFTDLEMPRLNGLQLLTHIKQDERLRHLPVVIISSRDDEEFRRQASENGVHDYLGKPIEDEALDRAAAAIPALRDVFGRKSFTTGPHGEYA